MTSQARLAMGWLGSVLIKGVIGQVFLIQGEHVVGLADSLIVCLGVHPALVPPELEFFSPRLCLGAIDYCSFNLNNVWHIQGQGSICFPTGDHVNV